jgi:hypothetical protein
MSRIDARDTARIDARSSLDASTADGADAREPDGVCEPEPGGTRTAPAFGAPTVTTSGLLVRVMNHCPFPLWIHGQGGDGGTGVNILQPDDAKLETDQSRDYDGKQFFGSARVTAFRDGPRQNEIQFVELHFDGAQLGYNISYVDYLGLPVEATAACGTTACYAKTSTILDGCPPPLAERDRCRSAGAYCSAPPHRSEAFCKALDAPAKRALSTPRCRDDLDRWVAAGHDRNQPGTTPAVYACTDFWASSAFCCALVNRGVVDAAAPDDKCNFYDAEPHNVYAHWVHQRCPQIYAFPYDDSGDHGGFKQCATRELRITWCPGG